MYFRKLFIIVSAVLLSLQACHATPVTANDTSPTTTVMTDMATTSQKAATGSTETPSSSQLWCYVCDDCEKINEQTPVQECNADFFAPLTTTGTAAPPTSTRTTTPLSTVSDDVTSTTEQTTTTETQTTSEIITEPPIPTPPTAGPVITTTPLPTPPNVGTVPTVSAEEAVAEKDLTPPVLNTTVAAPSLRRRRAATVDNGYTYHCFSIQKNVNGSKVTQRGCSRVTDNEGVCSQLEQENNETSISKCTPCTMPRCNGSSALTVSIMAFVVAIVAALLRSN